MSESPREKLNRLKQEAAAITAQAAEIEALIKRADELGYDLSPRSTDSAAEQPIPRAETESNQKTGPASDKDVAWLVGEYLGRELKVTHQTKESYRKDLRRIERDYGHERLSSITDETLKRWHDEWRRPDDSRLHSAFSLMGKFRILVRFGDTALKDPACRDIRVTVQDFLHRLRSEKPKPPPAEGLTADQANAVRSTARTMRRPSIALAQAFQYGAGLLQVDVVGHWVPIKDRAKSDVCDEAGKKKWVRGLRWNQIDENLILRFSTPGRSVDGNLDRPGKSFKIDLRDIPMVIDELQIQFCKRGDTLTRARLPASGPIIRVDRTGLPYEPDLFRAIWRRVARAANVPQGVKNKNSRVAKSETRKVSHTESRGSAGNS
jgi:hypothetical protein